MSGVADSERRYSTEFLPKTVVMEPSPDKSSYRNVALEQVGIGKRRWKQENATLRYSSGYCLPVLTARVLNAPIQKNASEQPLCCVCSGFAITQFPIPGRDLLFPSAPSIAGNARKSDLPTIRPRGHGWRFAQAPIRL